MKSKTPQYIWYLAILHIGFPLFFLIKHIIAPTEWGFEEVIAMISGVTAFFLMLFYYSSLWALRIYKKLNWKSAWAVFVFTIVFPWLFLLILRFTGQSDVYVVKNLAYIVWFVIWLIPFGFGFYRLLIGKNR